MSLETTYAARARASALTTLIQRAIQRLGEQQVARSPLVQASLCSTELSRLATAPDIAAALDATPLARAVVEIAQGGQLLEADGLMAQAKAVPTVRAAPLRSQAQQRVRAAVQAAAGQLAVQERQAVTVAAERVLHRLGFSVRCHDGQASSGVSAVRADHSEVLVLVHDGGMVQTDIQGCSGASCVPLQQEFESEMADEGVVLDRSAADVHGRDEGGTLIARAGLAASDGRLEVGVVHQHEHGIPTVARDRSRTTPVKPAAARRQRGSQR